MVSRFTKGTTMRRISYPNRRLASLAAAIGLLAATAAGMFAVAPVLAAGAAVVLPEPLSVGMRSGEEKSVSIRVENATDLYGIEFQLSFDPKVVQVQDADDSAEGTQLEVGDWMAEGFIAANRVDNKKGTIVFAATLLNPAEPLSGDGTIATIPFIAKGNGTSPLEITKTLLATRDAEEIESQAQNGAIGVSALGQAPRVTKSDNNSGGSSASNNRSDSGISTNTLILAGVAGIGVLGFFAALLLLGGIILLKRR
jgi:hypothetical protein